MVLFRITENEPSKMHNVRPYVYSRPWVMLLLIGVLSEILIKTFLRFPDERYTIVSSLFISHPRFYSF